jgi:hypothetical protein
MNKQIIIGVVALAVMLSVGGPVLVSAETGTTATTTVTTSAATDLASLLAKIQELTKILTELKARMAQVQGEVKVLAEGLKDGWREGMSGDDIRKIQEILASDRTIYPSGLQTGYFGPMTKDAIRAFQAKNGLEVTGEINAETKAAFETIMAERMKDGKIPPGFLHAPGLQQKFEDRLRFGCLSEGFAKGPFCARFVGDKKSIIEDKHEDKETDDDEDENDDGDSHEDDTDDAAPATQADATEAIADAAAVIKTLEQRIVRKEYASSTPVKMVETAKSALKESSAQLARAKYALTKRQYQEADTIADMAEDRAEAGIRALGGAVDDDDEVDDDDDDENEDTDESEDE